MLTETPTGRQQRALYRDWRRAIGEARLKTRAGGLPCDAILARAISELEIREHRTRKGKVVLRLRQDASQLLQNERLRQRTQRDQERQERQERQEAAIIR
jgi:hypothetical protein